VNDLPHVAWLRQLSPSAPVALVLPGGKARSQARPSALSFGQLRMRPFATALADGLPSVSVGTVQYRHRGWNAPDQDPAQDVRTVLDAMPGDAPVVLVGHSMGGRAAIAAADHPRVTGVVGMAPWLPEEDGVQAVAGRTVVLAHGTQDRWVHTNLSADWARRARGVPERLARFVVEGDNHTMFRHARRWHRLAVLAGAAVLGLGVDPLLEDAFTAGARGELAVALPELPA
jgi:dienelactone hydrolase